MHKKYYSSDSNKAKLEMIIKENSAQIRDKVLMKIMVIKILY